MDVWKVRDGLHLSLAELDFAAHEGKANKQFKTQWSQVQ